MQYVFYAYSTQIDDPVSQALKLELDATDASLVCDSKAWRFVSVSLGRRVTLLRSISDLPSIFEDASQEVCFSRTIFVL